jgi:predicted nucleic acid-binding protein
VSSLAWRPSSRRSWPGYASSAVAIGWTVTPSTTVRFADTNILLYAISRDAAEQEKAQRANEILSARDIVLSVQVMQEFYVQATRKSRPDAITHEQAIRLIESFRRFEVQDITTRIMSAALATCQRFQLSYWDAAIIEASRALGCDVVLSEDLGDGQDYAGVRVQNPFRQPDRG